MAPSRWTISRNRAFMITLTVLSAALVGILHATGTAAFGDPLHDGFYMQMQTVVDNGGAITHPLSFVHNLRFLVFAPLYFAWTWDWPVAAQGLILLAYLWPILRLKSNGRYMFVSLILLATPLFLSYRSVIAIVGIGYLFAYLNFRNAGWGTLAISALFANLSSGSLLAWILILGLNARMILALVPRRIYRIALIAAAAVVAAGLANSIAHKLVYFSGSFATAIARNTLIVSYQNGEIARLVIYAGLLAAVAAINLFNLAGRASWRFASTYIVALTSFLFEGLGPVSFLMPVLWYASLYLRGKGSSPAQGPATIPATARS